MAYESPGQGLARGIIAGTEMGLRVRREGLLEDQVKRRNAIEDEELAWKRSDRERKLKQDEEDRAYTEGERFLKWVEEEYKQTQAAMQAASQRYGNNVPPEVAQPLTQQFQDVNQRRHAARQKLYGPIIEKEKRKARDIVTGLTPTLILTHGGISLDMLHIKRCYADAYKFKNLLHGATKEGG